jgi:hypothetical protein
MSDDLRLRPKCEGGSSPSSAPSSSAASMMDDGFTAITYIVLYPTGFGFGRLPFDLSVEVKLRRTFFVKQCLYSI